MIEPAGKVAASHYDQDYFVRQSAGGRLQGAADAFKFQPYLRPGDRIVDFGCGGGYMLERFGGGVGIEINPAAVTAARNLGLRVECGLAVLADASADIVISNHALEHVEHPLREVREMHRVLVPGGRLVLVVPCDRPHLPFRENDPDFHLYSWSANNLGNLVRAAGFWVIEAREIVHAWPPRWQQVQRILGWPGFHLAARFWGRIRRVRSQVRVVAVRDQR